MITFRNVTLRRGRDILLKQLDWTIYHKQHIGIIGANGAGKSSLFSMILGQLQPEEGDLNIPRQMNMAHVAQETPSLSMSAIEFVLDGDNELRSLQSELADAEFSQDGTRIALLHEKLSVIDAYTANARAAQLLNGLGFSQAEQQKSVGEFSGGWRVRLNLAKALMCRSDILLLDEPTNHLDLDAVLWLEQWLKKYAGTLLIISHDRDFLDEIVDHVAHIHDQQLKLYAGNYSAFEKQKAENLRLQQAAYEKQQKKIEHLQSFVNRFRAKATKAKQAQSRLKTLERMELVCAVQTESAFQFAFKTPEQCPNPLLTLEKASIAYGDKTVLSDLTLSIKPRDRIAILGPNGAGKSSLIKLLAGEIQPAEGEREAAPKLKIGYFAQHQVDQLHLDETPLLHLKRLAENQTEQELRTYLGSFGFTNEDVFKLVAEFSGGEKSRLALALLVWQKPNLLLLDEPTNHLDLEMRNALSLALQEYEGAMIVVSHDRFLVRSAADTLLLAANGKLINFDGDLQDYQKWLFDFRKQQLNSNSSDKSILSKKEQRQHQARQRDVKRPLLQKIKQLEDNLEKLEKELSAVEMLLTDLTLYELQNKKQLQQHLQKQALLKSELAAVEQEWLVSCEERDDLE